MRELRFMGSKKSWTLWTQSLLLAAFSGAIAIALFTFDPNDPSLTNVNRRWSAPNNQLGYLGSWSADFLFQCFGWASWIIPLFGVALIILGHSRAHKKDVLSLKSFLSLAGLMISAALLVRLTMGPTPEPRVMMREGFLGMFFFMLLRPVLGKAGTFLLATVLLWIAAIVHFESWLDDLLNFFSRLGKSILVSFTSLFKFNILKSKFENLSIRNAVAKEKIPNVKEDLRVEPVLEEAETPAEEPVINTSQSRTRSAEAEKKPAAKSMKPGDWKIPKPSMLTAPKFLRNKLSRSELLAISKKITDTLKSFDVEGEITEITPGPILTIYEFQPSSGTRVQKIVATSTDLAMALGAAAIRIVAPIPGKSVAGIEVPNPEREEIVLRELLEITNQKTEAMRLPLCMGKDTEGKPVIEDLSRMPHLLIGGATSMGKSVLVNSILTGLLCRFSPHNLRLIIVDPKLVEFKIYEDIPHLLLPIVNEATDASKALKWAVAETKRRYLKMQEIAAKNLDAYNEKALSDSTLETFPFIVIIIDELAELMLTAKKDVEQSIVRLTQLARAAGIHLIMATQRPSADVVTGLIKSNCPSRAALRVASSMDSRIILDSTGAELLLGKGDMFFTSSGPMGLRRMQGSFVSDGDVEKICDFWREQGSPEYQNEILADESENEMLQSVDRDPLYGEVISYAKEKGAISTSLIQRRFQIGYTRAARIMEQLEVAGVVGEQAAAGKPRDVLI